jgi:hypothetical protein
LGRNPIAVNNNDNNNNNNNVPEAADAHAMGETECFLYGPRREWCSQVQSIIGSQFCAGLDH